MKIKNKKERLAQLEELYRASKEKLGDIYEKFKQSTEQYNGSDAIDGSYERASMVRNITYEIIESQVSSEIPAPCVSPLRYSEKRDRNAKSVERLLSQVRNALPFEELNDIDERYTYILGGSVWLAEWDSTIVSGRERGGVRVHSISPMDFIPEPDIYRIEDMEYCFIRFDTTRAEVIGKYGVSPEDAVRLSCESVGGNEEAATVIVCFYYNEKREVSKFAFCGDVVLLDIEDYYARKKYVCRRCGADAGSCECSGESTLVGVESETLSEDVVLRNGERIPRMLPHYIDGALDIDDSDPNIPLANLCENKIRYYKPSSFPIVIRKNTSKDKSLFGQSDCEFVRAQQQGINKLESRIMQKLMRSGVTPIVPDDAEITVNNQIFGQLIKLKPGDDRGKYGIIDTTPNITQDIEEADRLYLQAKRIVGISDSFQGFGDETAQSGVAKQLQVNQSAGRLQSKKKMKHSAWAALDKIIFSYYLAYADEPKELAYKDSLGRMHNIRFNRYDFLEYDNEKHEYYYDDGYLFSVDQNTAIEEEREYIWQKNLENLQAGTLGEPTDKLTLLRYWQAQERAHYPFARDNVEYFRELIESEVPLSDSAPVQDTDIESSVTDKSMSRIFAMKEGVT